MKHRKRQLSEHREDSDYRQKHERPEIYVVLDRIRSLHNVGSIFRTADGFGVRKLFLSSYTPAPPRPEIAKTAIGAEKSAPFECVEDAAVAVLKLRQLGCSIVALEQTDSSRPVYEHRFGYPLAIIVGHEVEGIDAKVLQHVDACVEIPMLGVKHSHNVAVATGITLSVALGQWLADASVKITDSPIAGSPDEHRE